MKQSIWAVSLAGLAILSSCGGGENSTADQESRQEKKEKRDFTSYGESFRPAKGEILKMKDLGAKMEAEGGAEGVFAAEIVQTCTKMGCWMNVKGPNKDTIMVYMKDHAFFVPLDGVQGNRALISGKAYFDTVSVELQKHLLEDAGAPQAEIDAITEPKFEMAIEAAGVMIADVPEGAPMAETGNEDGNGDGNGNGNGDGNGNGNGNGDGHDHDHEGHTH
jgi:hypothetical protein